MEENNAKTLDDKVTITLGKKTVGGLISAGVGLAIGVGTRLTCGENAYTLPGGAVAGGMITSFSQKAKPIGFLINIASCEAGYYAGVYATEYALNLMK